jgi:hypothetical protein
MSGGECDFVESQSLLNQVCVKTTRFKIMFHVNGLNPFLIRSALKPFLLEKIFVIQRLVRQKSCTVLVRQS